MNLMKLWHDVTKSQFFGPGHHRRTDSSALSNSSKEIAALKMVIKAHELSMLNSFELIH